MNKAYVLEFPGTASSNNLKLIDQYIAPEATCTGACVFATWAQVEARPGLLDTRAIEARLDDYAALGKNCALIVWGNDYNNPNGSTPEWVKAERGYRKVVCDHYGEMPITFGGAYHTRYKQFVRGMLELLGDDLRLNSIRFGLGVGGETYPACYYTILEHEGYSPDQFDAVWLAFIEEMAEFQAIHAGSVRIDLPMNAYGSPPRIAVCDAVAAMAARKGMSFGTQGLSQADMTQPPTSNWIENFELWHGRVPLHLQTKAATDPTNAPGGPGSLDTLIPFALDRHCEIFELYLNDWRTAYDPTYKHYAQYGAAYRAALESIYA